MTDGIRRVECTEAQLYDPHAFNNVALPAWLKYTAEAYFFLQLVERRYHEVGQADGLNMLYEYAYAYMKREPITANDLAYVEALLHAVPVDTYPLGLLIGLLVVTRLRRNSLAEARAAFHTRLSARLDIEAPERKEALLRGLL